MFYRLVAILLVYIAFAASPVRGDDWQVLDGAHRTQFYDWLLTIADRQATARQAAVAEALRSPEQLATRQQQLLADFRRLVGPLPERTPLNARTVGQIDCDGYRIERVVFESRPRHHVTANLYLPADVTGPVPGVLVPCGHSANGKASEAYQSACILLAQHGCAALIYDPIGQGERNQLPDTVAHGTNEHTLVGVGALLVGWTTGTFRIWDGLRAMDYLASRPEVDPTRLGCTGNSGGGTMTTWLMALDQRIEAAAPSCFITTLERLFHTIGPQDCEQHFPGQGPLGIDHTDFITMRAPRPTLILAAERDYFDFAGTREAARQADAVYRLLGHPERVNLFSYDDQHGFSTPRREAAVHWMRRWLADDDRVVRETAITLQSDADLQVTAAGQVVQEFSDEQTVVDFNRQRAAALREARQATWSALELPGRRATICQLLGIVDQPRPEVRSVKVGRIERERYVVLKFRLERDGEMPLPALLCIPHGAGEGLPGVLYLNSAGKAAAFAPDGPIDQLLADGQVVLAVDLRGYGETEDQKSDRKYMNDAFRTSMLAMHVGRPLLGGRVQDVLASVDFLVRQAEVDASQVRIHAVGRAAPAALHAAVLDDRIATLETRDSIRCWEHDVVARPLVPQMLELAVPGVLAHYDLSDLAALLGERLSTVAAPAADAGSSR